MQVVLDNQLLLNSNVVTTTAADGRYRVELPRALVTWMASASMIREFLGVRYRIDLQPTDPSAFAGNSGGIRSFVWRIRGPDVSGQPIGGSVLVERSLENLDLDASAVELTLVPDGPAIDGSTLEPIVGTPVATGDGRAIVDVPLARYTITARERLEGGGTRALRIRVRDVGDYQPALVTPLLAPFGTSFAIHRVTVEVRR